MNNFGEKVNFLWSIAELLRDRFKRGKYQDVILPFTVLRRIDCVLAPTKERVLETHAKLKGKLDNLDPQLRKASGFAFYNTSKYDFTRLLQDPPSLATNLRTYLNGFSENMREVLEKFDFPNTIAKLDEHGLLLLVMERFASNVVDLHPDKVSNHEMGTIFEELVRRFNEALDENPGEHFTPREVVRLMVLLLLSVDREVLKQKAIIRTVCDPCCGTGGMLTTAKEQILEINPHAEVHMFGHESQPETFALCKADLYMVSADGRDADTIKFGSTLSGWQLGDRRYDYQCANPPYGKDWEMDEAAVEAEAERGFAGRFGAGLPRISDGQLLFLQHMLARMKDPKEGGGRVAIVMNGSPLFTGDAGSGESEIRRWVLENDWLEAIIALPEQLFYNTGIGTYIWVLSNRKEARRKHKVQLIDASGFWAPMRKSLGNKRREISAEHIQQVLGLFQSPKNGEHCRIFDTSEFGYRKITVERPLRLNFQASAERLERLREERAFQNLAASKKKEAKAKAAEEAEGRQQQAALLKALGTLPATVCKDRTQFLPLLDAALKKAGLKVGAPVRKAILSALSERDETAEICRDEEGQPEADAELRDTENVPLNKDVDAYFAREVKPHVPEAWINTTVRDAKDGEVGKVGYEYQLQPLLLPIPAASSAGRDRGRHQDAGRRNRGDVGGNHPMSGKWKRYPAYRESGVEWLGAIPANWTVTKLGAAASVKARLGWKGLKASEYVPAGYMFLSTPNIKTRDIDFENVDHITAERYFESPEIMLRVGDVLIAKDGSTLGTSNVVRQLPAPATVNSSLAVVRPKAPFEPHFLWRFLSGDFTQSVIQRMKGGMGVPHLFQADLRKFIVLRPPIAEQEAIAAFLDRETAKIDALVAKKERLIELLQEKRTALISHAVTRGLNLNAPLRDSGIPWIGRIPAHWEVKRLKYLTSQVTVGIVVTPSKYYVDSGVPALRSLNVDEGRLNDEDLVYISEPSNRLHGKSMIHLGDLVAVRSGQPGTTAVVDDRFDGANCIDLIIVRKSGRFDSAWLCLQMNSECVRRQFDAGSGGAIQQHFNIETAGNLQILVPPLTEQEHIAEKLTADRAKLDALRGKVRTAIERLQEYRTALISAAVTGQIDVRDTMSQGA